MALPRLLGTRYDIGVIINPVPGETTYVKAGPLTFGIEYRYINDKLLDEHFADDPEKNAVIVRGFDEEGIAVHVMDSATGTEYLRFDGFTGMPHYHYIYPGSHHVIVNWDELANGPFLDWVPVVLAGRLEAMLAEGVGVDEAHRLVTPEVHGAIEGVVAEIDRLRGRLDAAIAAAAQ